MGRSYLYDYELFKINRSYEKLESGGLGYLCNKYYLNRDHLNNILKGGGEKEIYGTYLIKKTRRKNVD